MSLGKFLNNDGGLTSASLGKFELSESIADNVGLDEHLGVIIKSRLGPP